MTQELRRLAEAATQGEWAFGSFHRILVVPVRDGVPGKHDHIADFGETEIPWDKTSDSAERYNNAAYIAAANPAAILSLLDRLEKAEKDAARCKRFIDEVCEETFDTWTNGYRMQQVAMNIKAAMEASK